MNFVGEITPPDFIVRWGDFKQGGLQLFISVILQFVLFIVGLYALWKFISAGFSFINSGGDPKKLSEARDKIKYTFVGILIIASSLVIAGVAGLLLYGDPMAFINPTFTGAPL